MLTPLRFQPVQKATTQERHEQLLTLGDIR